MEEKYINLENAMHSLENALEDFELDLEIDFTKDEVNANNWVNLASLNTEAFFSFSVFENGFGIFTIFLNNIQNTLENLEKINQFNKNGLYFRAYISDEEEVVLEHSVPFIPEDCVYDYACHLLAHVFGDTFINSLAPIVALSYDPEQPLN